MAFNKNIEQKCRDVEIEKSLKMKNWKANNHYKSPSQVSPQPANLMVCKIVQFVGRN